MNMETVTANELKTKGVSAVEDRLKIEGEVIITVRGRHKYVVMSLEKYSRLREYELVIEGDAILLVNIGNHDQVY
jgi:PHD/YefM family antitoxin component YafN of YafNO toxin-antitoxin module